MPPEEIESKAQTMEVELFSYLCGATWLTCNEYKEMLEKTGF